MQETEKQLWEIVRSIPGLNVTYGTVRCIVYVVKKDQQESKSSAIGAAKGVIQTAAITAGVITAPVTIPLVAGVLTGIVAKSVSDTMEVLVFVVTNTEQFHGKSGDEREQIFYEKVKNTTGIGAIYSAVRVPVYLFKKNKQQSIMSSVNLMENSGNTAVHVGMSMLPNVDEQIQKLIIKTSRHAIKFLAKKIMEQVSQKQLSLEKGIATIAQVENDCQSIMEATTVSEESSEKVLQSIDMDDDMNKSGGHVKIPGIKSRRWFWCCCTRHRKQGDAKGNGDDRVVEDNITGQQPFKDSQIGGTGEGGVGQLIILTD